MATTSVLTGEAWADGMSKVHDGPGGYTGVDAGPEWAAEIKRLARARGA